MQYAYYSYVMEISYELWIIKCEQLNSNYSYNIYTNKLSYDCIKPNERYAGSTSDFEELE